MVSCAVILQHIHSYSTVLAVELYRRRKLRRVHYGAARNDGRGGGCRLRRARRHLNTLVHGRRHG